MKSILVSRPSFFVLVLALVMGLAACERPLKDEEEAAPASTPSVEASNEDNEAPLETPAASEEIFLPDIQGEVDNSTDVEASPAEPAVDPESAIEGVVAAAHVIQVGDSLFTVAQQYNVSLDDLAAVNDLDVNALLSPGSSLILPGVVAAGAVGASDPLTGDGEERIHIVQAGENLYRIGLVYGFTIEEIAAYNALENPDYIDVGQEIRIPPGGTP